MRKRLGLVLSLGLAVIAGGSSKADEFPIGVARVDVTPTGPIRLHGYLARSTETTSVSHPIFAKALAVGSDADKPVVLVSVDSLGVSAEIVDEVAARLKKKVGLPRERLALGASHTHYAPLLTGVAPNIFGKPIPADQQERIDAYTRDFTDKLESVCLAALADRKPATLSWAQGTVGFAANRRNPPNGPVDHALPVLKVTAPDGKVRAVVTNYACHCTTIKPEDNKVDGDWAGAAQRGIEADNPGSIALTVVGCGADSNPKPRGTQEDAENHGRALADEVARLMKGPWKPLTGKVDAAMDRFPLSYDTLPTRADLEKLIAAGGPPGYNATKQLARLERDGKLADTLPYSAQAWRFGDDLMMVFLPGEVVVDYVLRLKKEFDASRLWVTAYANDAPCYIPSERILKEGGYEGGGAMVYYDRPTKFKPGLEQVIVDGVRRVAGKSFEAPAKAAQADDDNIPALSPQESLAKIRTKPGLKVELVAAEPLIESPVAVDFGPDGRLWVCEMFDYPAGLDGKYKPGGRIKVLEDRDHDGKYDTATVFLDGLPFPTGVTCWRKGVLISAAPQIIYAEDADGDGKADVRKILYEGFATENYQARVNGLAYASDGWVYGANGLIGGKIHGRADGRDVEIGGRDFRFKPDLGVFEPASGLTQQGRVHDDWGNQFGGSNSVLIQHYPLPDHYVRRNPRASSPPPAVTPKGDVDQAKLYPDSRTLTRFNEPQNANRVTSACSPLVHRDPLLGDEYQGNAFVCEPVHNLVRRMVLTPQGATFAGRRASDEQDHEFLASTDSWFRPVQVRTGPDGALWVVDMYRFIIEHPRWISPDRLAKLDVRAGADKGRIYRVVPEQGSIRPVVALETLGTPALAAAIETPNGTVRDTVQRLLDHRQDHSAKAVLTRIARESKIAEARAQAVAALDVTGDLDSDVLIAALSDEKPNVRREAVRIAESRLTQDPAIGQAVVRLASDPDVRVRYQTALSLGEWPATEAGQALASIAVRDGADSWLRAAVLTSATPHAHIVLERLIAEAGPAGPPSSFVGPLIATLARSQDREAVAKALAVVASSSEPEPTRWRLSAAADLLDSAKEAALAADPRVLPLIASARKKAVDAKAPAADRIASLRLLGRNLADRDSDRSVIADRLDPVEPAEVQTAALQALARLADAASDDAIILRWNRLGPGARSAAIDALVARDVSAASLLTAVESGRIPPSQIGAQHRERLLKSGPEAQRKRAEAAFGSLAIGPRADVLARYESAKSNPGDPVRGKGVFQRACSVCHKLEGVGVEVGPDLGALTDLSPDALLTAILDPNREIDARYVSYNAALKDGRTVSGLIASETASSLTLKRQEGALDVVLRDDIEEISSSGRSLMPEGLENDLKPEEIADVIAYLGKGASRPKVQDGNRPQVVKAGPGGVVRLTAATAEIYGPSLVFETEHANLGYWHSPADYAAWTVEVDHGSMFDVSLEWACDDASAGNTYLLNLGRKSFRGAVSATGGWSNYRKASVTNEVFHKAVHRVEIRPDGPIRGALADLRAIILTPAEAGDAGPETPAEVARAVLDSKTNATDKQALIDGNSDRSAALIAAMAEGLDAADEAEEYRRIPWIWRVAIAAGKRDDAAEMKRILDVSLPPDAADAKLNDWRAVVLGGGLINGVSMTGPMPGARFMEVLRDEPALKARWDRSIALAAKMADDEKIRKGTRYDALRMLGVEPWEKHGEHLTRYLAPGIDPELHQGAVCALADVPSTKVVAPLLDSLGRLTPGNRTFAMQALVRDADRREALVDALESGKVKPADLSEQVRAVLVTPEKTRSAERAKRLLAPSAEKAAPGAALLVPFDVLVGRLREGGLRILDARPKDEYEKSHIPGAAWVDVKKAEALAAAPGGLQDANRWTGWIADLGIDPKGEVVVYDAKRQLDAARVWWLLSYLGVERVGLLDGGFPLWERQGLAVDSEPAKVTGRLFPISFRKDRLASREDVSEVLKTQSARIVDARSEAEHVGERVLSKRGGRIPGACPVEWVRLVDADGRFLNPEALRAQLRAGGLQPGSPVVSHCQGGGRASVDAFVLERLGFSTRNYYLGWSDWGNAEDLPIETGPLKK